MNKEIIDSLIKKERERYEAYRYAEYNFVTHNLPFGYGYIEYCKIKGSIPKIVEARGEWKSLFDFIVSSLQISVTEGKAGANYHEKTYYWLEGIK